MAKQKQLFVCSNCGAESPKWVGKCPECNEWNTYNEKKVIEKNIGNIKVNTSCTSGRKLGDVVCDSNERIITGINEFDRIVGGGLIKDSLTILSAPPGQGKSTLSIMLADKMIGLGLNVLYASGEESASQIKNRAKRLELKNIDDMYIADDNNLDFVIREVEKYNIDFIILDSIQTFYLEAFLPSRAGNPTQVIECASSLRDICKRTDRPRAAIIIGQMTKDDELAGSRGLEHLVDTYIRIDGDRDDTVRTLYAVKNRFGNTGETGFFNMTGKGLVSIDNPSEYFMTERNAPVIGASLTTIKEGTRIIIAEIESLVSKSFTTFPTRISENIKRDNLNILVSILEQRAFINLYDKNVAIKTSGGVRLSEPANNLAVIMSIASSFFKKPLPDKAIFIGDVGLTGEIKKCPNIDIRLKEIDRLGYKLAIVSHETCVRQDFKTLKILQFDNIKKIIEYFFNK